MFIDKLKSSKNLSGEYVQKPDSLLEILIIAHSLS